MLGREGGSCYMRVVMLGDVVGQAGCNAIREKLPAFKRANEVDLVVANGENSAEGNGILPASANHLLDSGVDVITFGNHTFRRSEIMDTLDSDLPIIRPANFHPSAPGRGYYLFDKMRYQVCVINLQGLVYMEPNRNPF